VPLQVGAGGQPGDHLDVDRAARHGLDVGDVGVDGLAGDLPGGGVLPPAGDLDGLAGEGDVEVFDMGGVENANNMLRRYLVSEGAKDKKDNACVFS
jgi:hypothetical protein